MPRLRLDQGSGKIKDVEIGQGGVAQTRSIWLPLAFLAPLWDTCPFSSSPQAENIWFLFSGPRVPGEPYLPESLVFSTFSLVLLDT